MGRFAAILSVWLVGAATLVVSAQSPSQPLQTVAFPGETKFGQGSAGGAVARKGTIVENDLLDQTDVLAPNELLLDSSPLGSGLLEGTGIEESGDPLLDLGPSRTPPMANEDLELGQSPGSNLAPNDPSRGNGQEKIDLRGTDGPDPHEALWTENCYPSAESCRQCHPRQYDEWRVSGHAYAMISPMFHRFEQAMTEYTRGTVGYFCIRCHSPVGVQLEIPRAASALDVPPVVREGVTCVACHRVREHYWRSNGDRRIEPGNIYQPVGSGSNGAGIADAVNQAAELKLKLSPHQSGPGQPMHRSSYFFEPLTNSDVCVSCHQVAVHPGIGLEVVHAQYRNGPAAKKGISCQQCHMGAVPGKPDGYEWCHAAEINGKPFGQPRKHSNHLFWGPGYSIAHPGIFPQNPDAKRYTPREMLAFDYRGRLGD